MAKKINVNLLKRTAEKSKREQRHASIIFSNGTPRWHGFNDANLHAEEMAVYCLGLEETEGKTMVNLRLTKGNRIALAKPCPACLDLLKEKKFRKVIYSTNEGGFEEIYL